MPNATYNYLEFTHRVPTVNGVKGKARPISFPRGARGFLYFAPPPPGEPLTAGELRFRKTGSADPASFMAGADLTVGEKPWRMSFAKIFHGNNIGLRELVLADGLEGTQAWRLYKKVISGFCLLLILLIGIAIGISCTDLLFRTCNETPALYPDIGLYQAPCVRLA